MPPIVRRQKAEKGHECGSPGGVRLVVAGAVRGPEQEGEGWAGLEQRIQDYQVMKVPLVSEP